MSKIKLFLDDERTAWSSAWETVRSYTEFVDFIEKHGSEIDVVSFDHDLGPEHYVYGNADHIPYHKFHTPTGLDCARYLVKYCQEVGRNLPRCFVHSFNRAGTSNIVNYLNTQNMFLFESDEVIAEKLLYNISYEPR
jgi:hypothetical protein